MDQDAHMLFKSEQMCAVVWVRWLVNDGIDFTPYPDGLARLSATDARFCEKQIKATEIREVMSDCTIRISHALDVAPEKFYVFMSDMFGSLLAEVYTN